MSETEEKVVKKNVKSKKIILKFILIIFLVFVLMNAFTLIKVLFRQTAEVGSIELNENMIGSSDSITIELENNNIEENVIEENVENSDLENKTTEIKESTTNISMTSSNAGNNNYPYYIKINYTCNTVTIYGLDSTGNYTIPIKAMVCSTGKATPRSGTYPTLNKYRWKVLNGNVWGQYSTRIYKGVLFHSVPYRQASPSTLITKYYDQLGTTASAGCIRLTTIDAKWIYDNCALGTKVEFYSSSNPGPLGKPTAKKISGYDAYLKCWDPTDPDSNNPWNNQTTSNTVNSENVETTSTSSNTETQNVTNTTSDTVQNTVNNTVTNQNTTQENQENSTNEVINQNTIENNAIDESNSSSN